MENKKFLAKKFVGGAQEPIFCCFLANLHSIENRFLSSGHQILQASKNYIKQIIFIMILSFTSVVSEFICKVSFTFQSPKPIFDVFVFFRKPNMVEYKRCCRALQTTAVKTHSSLFYTLTTPYKV